MKLVTWCSFATTVVVMVMQMIMSSVSGDARRKLLLNKYLFPFIAI
jgi:hypothetical protein